MMKHVNTNEIGIHTLSDAELDKVYGGSIGGTIHDVASSILGYICKGDGVAVSGRPGQVICYYQ
jgi:hypothetical protein